MNNSPTVLDFDDEVAELPEIWSEDEPQGIVFDKMIEGMSNTDYHAVDAISSTQFKLMRISMSAYDDRHILSDRATFEQLLKHEHISKEFAELAKEFIPAEEMGDFLWEPNPAFATGNLYHDCILLPHIVKDGYVECSTKALDTNAADKLRVENSNKIVIGKGETINALKAAGMVFRKYGKFINPSKKEVSFFHADEETGLVFKARPDIYSPELGVIMDIKSTNAKNHKEFLQDLEKYDYDLSAAWYIDTLLKCGYPANQFYWIVVPKQEPHLPFAFVCSQELLEKGRSKYQMLLADFMEFKSNREGFDHTLFKEAFSWEYRKEFGDGF